MRKLFEHLSHLNWLLIPETMAGSARHHKSVSPKTLAGLNDWPFYVQAGQWSGRQIDKLLKQHGIKTWGWTFLRGEMMFRVKKSQAEEAQRIMLEAGVPLCGRLIGGK